MTALAQAGSRRQAPYDPTVLSGFCVRELCSKNTAVALKLSSCWRKEADMVHVSAVAWLMALAASFCLSALNFGGAVVFLMAWQVSLPAVCLPVFPLVNR